ncbi:Stk1 family PASTA domain-containing Ser/Thr kinase [Leekyejoonella antrihumi]|uniref:Stk1 family PASTA domain-containing Ser/Thr kinase n=1 Tax=Leekyejoonella antrihumi TaxID=1660198 RepID=UPI001FE722D5|nr:Stk1 family PASTA domain-containing Ser/Thr kinase [Leekyejoonella antrihumi]
MTDTAPRILGGRYEIGELIGRGGMAEVHIGHDTRLGRTVAIKMLRADLARDTVFLTRFRREAQSAAGLTHHAIVAVYDSGEDVFIETGGAKIDVPYIVMEYIDGKTLREILDDEGKLSSDEAARITMGVLSALEYSHEKGIVHRDIKPGNVMLTRGGSVKVMDFGIARALADTGATMTSAQAVVGTARYLSPEQAQGETVDARSDLYSAGCVLFELLTGRTPFVGEAVSLVYQHITDPAKAPSVFEQSVSREMDAVTLHALEKPRDTRYQTAGDFRTDIQTVRTGQQPSEPAVASLMAAGAGGADALTRTAPAVAAEPARRSDYTAEMSGEDHPRRRTGLWIVAGICALLAILGIGYLVMNGNTGAKTAKVQDVRTFSLAQATRVLKSDGFTVKTKSVQNDATKGTVINQDPTGGTEAKLGSAVLLSVSGGPGTIAIPDVAGMSQSQAMSILQSQGFTHVTPSSKQVDNTKFPANQVAGTTPAIGTAVDPSSTVTLVISSGQVTVPTNLVGKDPATAQAALTAKYLVGKIAYKETSNPAKVNKVIDVPEAGNKVAVNSDVTIVVGTPAPVIVPPTTVTVTPPPPSSTSSSSSPSSSSSSSPSSSTSPSTTPKATKPPKP